MLKIIFALRLSQRRMKLIAIHPFRITVLAIKTEPTPGLHRRLHFLEHKLANLRNSKTGCGEESKKLPAKRFDAFFLLNLPVDFKRRIQNNAGHGLSGKHAGKSKTQVIKGFYLQGKRQDS